MDGESRGEVEGSRGCGEYLGESGGGDEEGGLDEGWAGDGEVDGDCAGKYLRGWVRGWLFGLFFLDHSGIRDGSRKDVLIWRFAEVQVCFYYSWADRRDLHSAVYHFHYHSLRYFEKEKSELECLYNSKTLSTKKE